MNFKDFYLLQEAKFRDSKAIQHTKDVPMFSIFLCKEAQEGFNRKILIPLTRAQEQDYYLKEEDILQCFQEARNDLGKMGFPSMHANVVIGNTPGAAGLAFPKRKWMALNLPTYFTDRKKFVKVIKHEWGHLWMFNNGKAFEEAIREYYTNIKGAYEDPVTSNIVKTQEYKVDEINTDIINELGSIVRNRPKPVTTDDYYKAALNIQKMITDVLKYGGPVFSNFPNSSHMTKLVNFIMNDIMGNPEIFQLPIHLRGREVINKIENYDVRGIFNDYLKDSAYDAASPNIDSYEIQKLLAKVSQWPRTYGMTNYKELWATAMESFFKLPKYHREKILDLMQRQYRHESGKLPKRLRNK